MPSWRRRCGRAGLLEKAGLITRSSSPADERSITVTITDPGRALVARLLPAHVEVVSRLLFEPLAQRPQGTHEPADPGARPHARDAAPIRGPAPPRHGATADGWRARAAGSIAATGWL